MEPAPQLLSWFDQKRRSMPWRETSDAYAIWVSEIMLQQTRVETVIPYYRRFVARFPTVDALAAADLQEVLGAWSGLGYYRRARSLHACAREVVATYSGRFPSTVEGLRSLPGIGAYTSGAIASMAYRVRAPAVDGNVMRVLGRYLGIHATPLSKLEREIRAAASELVPSDRPGDFNQALMDLGATVCVPENPRCPECPWEGQCVARRSGIVKLPPKAKPPRALSWVSALVRDENKVLLARRPDEGLFGGLWEPPAIEATLPKAKAQFAAAGIELLSVLEQPLIHVLTHRRLSVRVAQARLSGPLHAIQPYVEMAMIEPERIASMPMSTLTRRLLGVSFPQR